MHRRRLVKGVRYILKVPSGGTKKSGPGVAARAEKEIAANRAAGEAWWDAPYEPQVLNVAMSSTGRARRPAGLVNCLVRPVRVSSTVSV